MFRRQTNKKRFYAFTLAEVLITLAIIGVVAALALPMIISNAQDAAAAAACKKTYAMLSQAVSQWQTDNDCIGESEKCSAMSTSGWPHKAETLAKELAPYLKVIDSSYASQNNYMTKSWIPDKAYFLDKAISGVAAANGLAASTPADDAIGLNVAKIANDATYANYLLLNNGVVLKISGIWGNYNVVFDINGAKKPNRYGKDQFGAGFFSDYHNSLTPYQTMGSYKDSLSGLCLEALNGQIGSFGSGVTQCNPDGDDSIGYSPTAYVMTYGKLQKFK